MRYSQGIVRKDSKRSARPLAQNHPLRQPCAHTSESTGDRRRVKTWRDGERTDGSGLKSRVMEYADTVHFHVESTPVLPKPDEYQKQSTSSRCRLSSAVDLLQHYFKRCFTCNILPLRCELEILSTSVDAERAGLQLSSWVDGRPTECATVKCSTNFPSTSHATSVLPQPCLYLFVPLDLLTR